MNNYIDIILSYSCNLIKGHRKFQIFEFDNIRLLIYTNYLCEHTSFKINHHNTRV